MKLETNIISLEKEKNNILFNIKCHNDLNFVTKNFFENLDDIIPELLQKRKVYQEILLHFISYNLFISLYYSFAPNFDKKNRIILQKYIYSQINDYNKNEIKEFTFLEIYFYFLDIINNESENNNNSNNKKFGMDTEYSKNIKLILSLYKYFDINKLNVNDENCFILENIIFINFFNNKSIFLKNSKNPGLSSLLLVNIFKDRQNIENDENQNYNNLEKKETNKNNNNNINTNNVITNVSNDIIINNENSIYRLIEINLNNRKIEKDLEYISKILNEAHSSKIKRFIYFIINNCNKDNIYLFNDLIRNSDNKKRASLFYLGKNELSLNNQVYFRIFFSSKEEDSISFKDLTYTKFINFNINSKALQNELKFSLGKINEEKLLNILKENQIKLIKLSLKKELYYKKICEIINNYEYETKENNYVNNKKLLSELENEIKNYNIKIKKFNKANKNIKIIKENLEHLTVLCTQSGKIYKFLQKYYSFSIQEYIILLANFYHDNKFDVLEEKEDDEKISPNISSNDNSNEDEEDEESLEKSENSRNINISKKYKNKFIKEYSNQELPLLINYLSNNKIESLLSKDNLSLVNTLKINLFLYYIKQNDPEKKANYDFYKKLLFQIKEILSNSIIIESQDISPIEIIPNENWNKLIYLSNTNNNIYVNIIKDIPENKELWNKLLSNSTNKDICEKIAEILNNNEYKDSYINKSLDILIIISFICPFRFIDVKEYLISKIYNKNIDLVDIHHTLNGFINSMENPFNNSQNPLILMELNKENLEAKIEYIKTILYPRLLIIAKFFKGVAFGSIFKSPPKNSMKLSNANINNNLLNSNEKNIPNNNIVSIDNKENTVKYMIIKENTKNINYENIIQFVKNGGLIIVNNINHFDNVFINQIINIINEAKINKYLDKTFRLIFTLSESFVNDEINDILLKNCVYFNIDLNNDLRKNNFKNKILENIKTINIELVLFYSNNIYRKKILINLIFLNCFIKEISENIYYNDIYEIEDILLALKKYIENNDLEFKTNKNYYAINYYYLFQFLIENILITRFSYIEEEFRIKIYIQKMIINENNFINDKKYLLYINNSNFFIENTNDEIDLHKLFSLFNNIPQYEYNNIISILKNQILKNQQTKEINDFFKNIKSETKQSLNTSKKNINNKMMDKDKITDVFQDFIQKIPENIILPLDEEINDENISKNLLKKEKNNMYINPMDELLIEEISYFNNEINKYRNKLQQLMELLNKNKYIKEDIINDIIKKNNIEKNIQFIINKYNFYKNWIKEGEINNYCLKYINNIQLLFYLLKMKYYKNKLLSLNKNETSQNNKNNIKINEFDMISINYNAIKTNDDSIEISGISFNLKDKYDLELIDNHLTIINKKNNLKDIEEKTFSLYIDFIEEDYKYKVINNNDNYNSNNNNLNKDLPLIKDQFDFNFDYDNKNLSCDFYQLKDNTFKQINEIKEKINIDISEEFNVEEINCIVLNGIFFYVNNSDCLKIEEVNI